MKEFNPNLESEFIAWWQDSYRNAPASGHSVTTHVAFAQHILDQRRIHEIRELAILMNEEPCH